LGVDYAAVAQRIRRTRSAQSVRTTSNSIKETLNVEGVLLKGFVRRH